MHKQCQGPGPLLLALPRVLTVRNSFGAHKKQPNLWNLKEAESTADKGNGREVGEGWATRTLGESKGGREEQKGQKEGDIRQTWVSSLTATLNSSGSV